MITQELIDCLETVVGLTEKDCPCLENSDRPADFNQSDSGFFLDDDKYGFPFSQAALNSTDCGAGSFWEETQKIRRNAIRDFLIDFRAAIYKDYEDRYAAFSGIVGKKEGFFNSSVSQNYSGIILNPKPIKGACLEIKGIELGLSCNGAVNVEIYKADLSTNGVELLHTLPLNASAIGWQTNQLSTPIELPLYDKGCDDLRYLIAFDATVCKPRQNKFTCCGKTPAWRSYFTGQGFQADDLTNIRSTNSYASGIRLDARVSCKAMDWVCHMGDINGYNAIEVIALGIVMKARERLVNKTMMGGTINKWTLCSNKDLVGSMKAIMASYHHNIRFLSENLPTEATNCLRCKNNLIGIGQIVAHKKSRRRHMSW